MGKIIDRGAEAMRAKRRELIAQPLDRIWPDLMRTAIEAMRQPTSEMCQAATRTEKRLDEGEVEVNYIVVAYDIWPKMIDAALSSEQEK